jgi:beta-lactamase superfamily II metal-dependent hydrolase
MFRIEMLPAAHGDSLWIEYGTGQHARRILIDGGPAHTYPALRERILHLPADDRHFDLLIITHIDGDHIEGVVRLLQDAEALNCRFDRIWFNGRDQLNKVFDPAGAPLGALQGEMLSMLISDYEKRTGESVWNAGLPDAMVAIDRDTGKLPVVDLPGDCRLTLLSPDHERLLELKDRWRDELHKARVASGDEAALRRVLEGARNLRPLGDVLGEEGEPMEGRFELPDPAGHDIAAGLDDTLGGSDGEAGADAPLGGDGSRANGSSIAVLLEYPRDKPKVRFLLAGDAWPSVLEASVDRLLSGPEERLSLTGFKLPHHGSVANVSAPLLRKLRCQHYLVSTSGAVFRHPHTRTVELLLTEHGGQGKPRLHFNYLTDTTKAWSNTADQRTRRYEAVHPKGLSLIL